jgi:hypothetical protein
MSKMSELYMEIELMLEDGTHPATISAVLECPVSFVYDVVESTQNETEEFSPFRTINS